VDVLLRRFTLDSGFSLRFEEIERFVAGKASENRVKVADVYSMDEIFALLHSNIISSDYVIPKKRKSTLDNLARCFRPPADNEFPYEVLQIERLDKIRSYIEVSLGVGSALLGAAVSVATAAAGTTFFEKLSFSSIQWELLVALGVSVLTAIGLVVFARLRDRTIATKPDELPSAVSKAREFESRVIERLRAIGTSISQQRDVDLIISFKGKKIAVELKWAPPSPTKLISIIKQMEKSLTNYGSDEGLIVIGSPVSDQIRNMSIGRVRIISVDEFFNLLTAPEPLRGAS
jgi:hypothetical protein